MAEKETDSVKLAVLEEKVFNMVEVISKLDDTIEKLSDLSVNVSKMLAVHEEKLDVARESAAETAKEIAELESRVEVKLSETKGRLRSIERRVWMGVGIAIAFAILFQPATVTDIFNNQDAGAIMGTKPK
jgi:predicted  nucleic acid-binding Zn-ribbon protein